MELLKILQEKQCADNRNRIVDYVSDNPKHMRELMTYFFDPNLRINQRAAWPLNFIARKHPKLIAPYHKRLIENLDKPHHDAVVRNTLRIYEDLDIPESIEGRLCEKCFDYISDPKWPAAIRCFSIYVLEKIVVKYPDLKVELIDILQEHLPHGTPGFKHRAKKVLGRI